MDTRLAIVQGDITEQDVDAIVNAANAHLAHGGGVAAAIARAGAPVVDRESREWVERHGPVLPGSAAETAAGDMKARNVIHVVGPVHQPGRGGVSGDCANVRGMARGRGKARRNPPGGLRRRDRPSLPQCSVNPAFAEPL